LPSGPDAAIPVNKRGKTPLRFGGARIMTQARDYEAEYYEVRRAWHASDGTMADRDTVAKASTRIARAAKRAKVELDEIALDERARRAVKRAATKRAAKKAPAKRATAKVVNKGRTCVAVDCDRPARARGLCGMHHTAWYRANVPGALEAAREASRRHAAKVRAAKGSAA
jgi:hypothetical protein